MEAGTAAWARRVVWACLAAGGVVACGGGGGGTDAGTDTGGDPGPDVPVVLSDLAYPDVADDAGNLDGPGDGEPFEDGDAGGDTRGDGEDLSGPDAPLDTPPDIPSDGVAEPGGPDAADAPHIPVVTSCGDGSCDPPENCGACPDDCGACPEDPCGDQTCDGAKGESCATCPKDCGACPTCGDQVCDAPEETCGGCPQDCGACPPACPDGACNGDETCQTCEADCGPCAPACPDGFCNGDETCGTCPKDCGPCPPACGDGECNGTETCKDCPGDCGECPAGCGDGECLGDEDCRSCPDDCGDCPPTLWFRADWSETLDGPIVAGGRLRIRYDLDRLTECRQTHNGYPGWTITVFYTDDLSKPANEVQVVHHDLQGGQSLPFEPEIDVPPDAHDLWFWANNTGVEGCIAWDSDYGKNYMMPVFRPEEVSAPVEWVGWGAGGLDFAYGTEGGPVSKGDVDPVWFFESLLGAEVTTEVRVQAYVHGITDRTYQNAAVAAEVAHTAVSMAAETDFAKGAGSPGATPVLVPLEFEFQADNNFFYRWPFGTFGYVWGIAGGPPPEGLYAFRLAARTPKGPATWVGRPGAPSHPRGLVYAASPDTGCPLFPGEPPPDAGCPGR